MSQDQKVVPLLATGTRRPGSEPFEQSASLPAPLLPVRDQTLKALRQALSELFDNTDDSLFELADRADNNAEQALFFDAMRVLRLQRHAIEKGCADAVLKGLVELNRTQAQAAPRPNYDLDTLTLVQPDELEQSVALEGMVGRVMNRNQQSLAHLAVRLNSLLKGSVDVRNNPLGPAALGQAFIDSYTPLGLDIKVRLIVLKLFERYVFNGIDKLYQQLNGILITAGVLPDLTRTDPQSRRTRAAGQTAGNALHSGGAVDRADHQQVLSLFSELIGNWRHASGDSALTGLGLSSGTPIASNELLGLLGQISAEEMLEEAPSIKAVRQRIHRRLDEQRRQTGEARSLGRMDDDVINLVSMLFDFILDDRNLPAALKVLVGRLQLPILRVAIADKSFFSVSSHPARRLLNELARATMGWNDHDDLGKDQLHQLLESLVAELLAEPEPGAELFDRLHAGLQSFVEAEQRRAGRFEQRTRDAEEGRARIEAARHQVAGLLNEALMGRTLPVLVVDFLRDAWSQVMQMIWLREGKESPAWKQAVESAIGLISSMQSCSLDEVDARRTSNRALLVSLAAQLDLLGNDPAHETAMLQRLAALQEAALPEPPAPAQDVAAPEADSETPSQTDAAPLLGNEQAQPAAQEIAAAIGATEEAVVETLEFPATASDSVHIAAPVLLVEAAEAEPVLVEELPGVAASEWLEGLRPGGWFELCDAEGATTQRCKLAAIIAFSGKYIFVNRSGMKVAEHGRQALALLYEQGRIRLLDDNQLFDRALESVIGNLRKLQSGKT